MDDLDTALALLRQWVAEFDNESFYYPAAATRRFLGLPASPSDPWDGPPFDAVQKADALGEETP
jgi:hypothetical protein